jgi:hypothetical protein
VPEPARAGAPLVEIEERVLDDRLDGIDVGPAAPKPHEGERQRTRSSLRSRRGRLRFDGLHLPGAAHGKDRVAREALWRIHRLFELERAWKDDPPATRRVLREQQSRPLVDAFLAWAELEYNKVKAQRGLLLSAFGYVVG